MILSRRGIGRAIVLGLVAGFALGGCGGLVPSAAGPSRPPPATSPPAVADSPATVRPSPGVPALLLLSGNPGAMALERIAPDGHRSGLALPDPAVAWVSGGPGGRIVVTTADGRLFVADASSGSAPVWRRIRPAGLGTGRLAGPLAFGTLDPDGKRVAVVAADYRTGARLDLVVVAVADGAASRFTVRRPPDGAPPAWAGSRLIVLTRERQDRPGVTLIDPANGAVTDGPGPAAGGASPGPAWSGGIAALAASADGATVALAGAVDGPIELRPAEAWLAGRSSAASAVIEPATDPDGSRGLAWLALSAAGDQLAVVRTDADGAARRVDVYTAADGWRGARSIALPAGAGRAVVAWLP